MDILWAVIVILVIFFVLFAVLPSLMSSQPPLHVLAPSTSAPTMTPSTPETRYQAQTASSKAMLDAQYQHARSVVPENYPRKAIGECPYSKPPSTDLPIPNVPMCVAVQKDNMRLHQLDRTVHAL